VRPTRHSETGRSSGTAPLARAYARDMADRFETAYLEGSPPWDIGRAQPELVSLAEASRITGRVIDLGCGSGENAISFAMAGLEVVGVDGSPEAIRQARDKAGNRGVSIRFDVADVLDLGDHRKSFDTATDSGVFHVLTTRTVLAMHTACAVCSVREDISSCCASASASPGTGARGA
jgi:2-polyprenyl-3-methyl-5-hydroxy-6-metoxy-1,4-benzoquinol methylase